MEEIIRKRSTIQVLSVLLFVIMVGLVGTWYLRQVHVRDEIGKPATDLLRDSELTPYKTLNGESFSFEPYRGKIRVVNVWASWSPYAAIELPILAEVVREFDRDQVVALAVNRSEPKERAQAYVASTPSLPELVYVIDETDAFYNSVGGYAMPETVIFNTAGDIVWHYRGVITKELLKEQIGQYIEE